MSPGICSLPILAKVSKGQPSAVRTIQRFCLREPSVGNEDGFPGLEVARIMGLSLALYQDSITP